ncbi:Initiation-specific alpha-1,6-mannosyltransferase [Sphaceloma murrayae]|uniref:Initiation-specific alpha-1,6-mannosyltransferase n=1 Tax=Sphaceloma murrayae TaxID=2082308 RepID=A0A2K1QX74_9PEZI|nr:Initiation-specific alpha-1,6-mannosyltransferase [Sphaceloma murrayae]
MPTLSTLRPFLLLLVIAYIAYLSITSKSISSQVKSVVPYDIRQQAAALSQKACNCPAPASHSRPSYHGHTKGLGSNGRGYTTKSSGSQIAITNPSAAKVAQLLDQPFPKQIWQKSPFDLRRRNTKNIASWHKTNKGWRHIHLSDEDSDEFVERMFKNRPSIVRFWRSLDVEVLKSDFLRYLIMLVKGGVYADSDTECVEPIDAWVPEEYVGKANVVVGIEFDGKPEWSFSKPIGFVQYAFMVKAGHPLMENLVTRSMVNMETLSRRQRKEMPDIDPDFEDILFGTGPGALGDAVVHHIVEQGVDFRYEMMHDIKEPRLIADVLVLPVNAFGWGQGHSNAGNPAYGKPFVKHKFNGSWFKSKAQQDDETAGELGLNVDKPKADEKKPVTDDKNGAKKEESAGKGDKKEEPAVKGEEKKEPSGKDEKKEPADKDDKTEEEAASKDEQKKGSSHPAAAGNDYDDPVDVTDRGNGDINEDYTKAPKGKAHAVDDEPHGRSYYYDGVGEETDTYTAATSKQKPAPKKAGSKKGTHAKSSTPSKPLNKAEKALDDNITDAMDVVDEHESEVAEEEEEKQQLMDDMETASTPNGAGAPTFKKKGQLVNDPKKGAGRKSKPKQAPGETKDGAGGEDLIDREVTALYDSV